MTITNIGEYTQNWCHFYTDSLNTNQFEVESQPSYYLVYSRRPKVYTYAPTNKTIPREEDVVEEEEDPGDETAPHVNEVYNPLKP